MYTSMIRRTLDPLIAATAATLICAVAAHSQTIVSNAVGDESADLQAKLKMNEKFVPDVVLYDQAVAKPKVDATLAHKMTRAHKDHSTPKSFCVVPGRNVQ